MDSSTFEIVFNVTAVLVFCFFIWQSVGIPTRHMVYRNKFFALRDRLRRRMLSDNFSDKRAAEVVENGLNSYVNNLDMLTIANLATFRGRYQNDPQLREQVLERRQTMSACQDPELLFIYERADDVLLKAFLTNAGGWFWLVLPISLLRNVFKSCMKIVQFVNLAFLVSPDQMEKKNGANHLAI